MTFENVLQNLFERTSFYRNENREFTVIVPTQNMTPPPPYVTLHIPPSHTTPHAPRTNRVFVRHPTMNTLLSVAHHSSLYVVYNFISIWSACLLIIFSVMSFEQLFSIFVTSAEAGYRVWMQRVGSNRQLPRMMQKIHCKTLHSKTLHCKALHSKALHSKADLMG